MMDLCDDLIGELQRIEVSTLLPTVRFTNLLTEDRRFYPVHAVLTDESKSLFSSTHIQFLKSHYFGKSHQATYSKHPLWHRLSIPTEELTINKDHNVPSNLALAAVSSLSTNVGNIWQSRLFHRMLTYVLRVLLRQNLSPSREQKTYDRMHSGIKILAEKKEEKVSSFGNKIQHVKNVIKFEKKKVLKLQARLDITEQSQDQQKLIDKKDYSERKQQSLRQVLNDLITKSREEAEAKKESKVLKDDDATSSDNDNNANADTELLETLQSMPESEMDTVIMYETDSDSEPEVTAIKDTSSRKIRGIQAVLSKLFFTRKEAKLDREVIENLWDGDDLLQHEINIMITLYNTLRPYIPVNGNKATIAEKLPFVFLGNAILHTAGYSKLMQRPFPTVTASALHALPLGAVETYEIFGSKFTETGNEGKGKQKREAPLVQMKQADGKIIKNSTLALGYKDDVFGSIFDLQKINAICDKNSMTFRQRLVIPNIKSAAIIGATTKPRMVSSYQHGKTADETMTLHDNRTVDDLTSQKATLEQQLLAINKKIQEETESLKDVQAKLMVSVDIKTITLAKTKYEEIGVQRTMKKERMTIQSRIAQLQNRRTTIHSNLYYLRKAIQVKKSNPKRKRSEKEQIKSTPTRRKQSVLDTPENMDLNSLRNEGSVSYSGTDYGIVTLSTAVPVSTDRYNFHLRLQNRYRTLADIHDPDNDDTTSDVDNDTTFTDEEKKFLILPKPFIITSKDLNWRTGFYHRRKKMEKKLKNTELPTTSDEPTPMLSTNPDQILRYTKLVQDRRTPMRDIYHSKAMIRERKAGKLQKQRVYARTITEERRFLKGDSKYLVMAIGNMGTGVGSRITGHHRRGGKWHLKKNSQRGAVMLTDEHLSSQTCVFCFSKVIRQMRKTDGKYRKVNGGSVCVNKDCWAVKNCSSTQGRDIQAALAICLAGVATTDNQRMEPFKKTVFNTDHSKLYHDNLLGDSSPGS
ncbi:uncharacterized protein BX664DRAFT_8905 [Halteromyces radiatus]|uniref:uncharacterized protein n=1 Tax=Halteromyces radiatus TaxID=101107 RepID=UPI0022211D9F|nr:uncharacterized protein BX664DRAFT_8905 [Halteromyces radiatus]KAI8098875.1 hypothetical protein BX664DRAFT_8905 [Halteromyces radiatus]